MRAYRWNENLYLTLPDFTKSKRRRTSSKIESTPACERLEDRTLLAGFVVDTLMDTPDAMPGDGLAKDASGMTSLRAAIDEAEALPGLDTISIPIAGTITRTSTGFEITDDLIITGPGADMLTLDAAGLGRGFLIFSSGVEISGITITGGIADPLGGHGIANFGGDLTLSDVRLTGNGFIGGGSSAGGGLNFGADFTMGSSPGTLTIINSLIDNNSAAAGGGINIGSGAGDAMIINSTISGNMTGSDGGGISYVQNDNTLVIRNSTISANRVIEDAPDVQIGGGIFVSAFPMGGDPLPELHNTIVAGNTAGTMVVAPDDINGTGGPLFIDSSTSSFNLIGDAATAGSLTDGTLDNIVGMGGAGTIPTGTILGPLADNGGATMTHALVMDSPAIDTGSNALAIDQFGLPLTRDQRGTVVRVLDGDTDGTPVVDRGAFEAPFGSAGGGGGVDFEDIVGRAASGTVVVLESDGTGFGNVIVDVISPAVDWDDFLTGDFNGDGLTDLAGRSSSDGMWRVILSNGSTFDPPALWGTWSTSVTFSDLLVGDFNGDELDDVVGRASTGTIVVGLSTGSSFATSGFGAWSTSVIWENVFVGDVNADGMDDLIGRASTNTWVGAVSTGTSFATSSFGAWSSAVSWVNVLVGDVNGDGRTDIIGRASNGRWVAGTSTGTRFSTSSWGGWTTTTVWSDVRVGDFNGDGRTDIVGRAANGRVVVGESNGTRFVQSGWSAWSTSVSWLNVVVGDFNDDGLDDLAGFASTGSWVTAVSDGDEFDTMLWGAWSSATTWDNVFAGQFV
ncbi:MAG: VCBS repeat-containing protein [Planctomycetaceae bacterium]|nr:VCBS repeat-containing protein [Planctomycetaceae bacterium]